MILKIILISLISLLFLFILFVVFYGIIAYFMFNKIFRRGECKSFLDIDLSKTHYAPHIEKIRENIKKLQNIPYNDVYIENDKLRLHGRFIDLKGNKVVIMAHGYHATPFNNFQTSALAFIDHGYSVLLIDERAHNDSEGNFSYVGLREQYDLLEWIKWVELETCASNIILYGVSMGSATLGYLSNKIDDTKVRAMVMDCGFTSFYDVIFYSEKKKVFSFLSLFYLRMYAKIFLKIDIKTSTLESLKETNTPIYFIHGLLDEMVPYEHTIASFNATKSPKKVRYVSGAGHTTGFLIDYDFLNKDLFEFLDLYLK